ncbi:SDR family NAD(P)-dependent oxidoreductase [Variovorax sp. dw_308]|uniref:SDR family NAD(P)-dependent oxidoreductase n=1 Tax=Variovorax sp. dw_308 TaxID=2721546 RepID=UPI001C43F9B3|nr:SDR family oxidoreductase [Variovorax sp. dw_308]
MDMGAMLNGQHVLVTGASSGLGQHFARLAARCGASVVIAARRKDRLDALAAELGALGATQATAIELDVASEASVAKAYAEMAEAGVLPDVVVNNAGIAAHTAAMKQSMQAFDDTIATNVRGVWMVSTEAARRWKAAGRGGVIVNIASVMGQRVLPGTAAYAASKAAVIHMTRALSLEWARFGIRVNTLAPGYIDAGIAEGVGQTPEQIAFVQRIPMQRLGQAEDLDGALLLLATPASSWMTGGLITVDGGHLAASL